MGFGDKIKEFFKKLKEENAGFASTMKRINSSGYCGNVNRGIKNGDFWEGSYVSIENGHGVIYGSNQPDYEFTGADIKSFEIVGTASVSVGDKTLPANSCIITFVDGKTAKADIVTGKLAQFKITFNLT